MYILYSSSERESYIFEMKKGLKKKRMFSVHALGKKRTLLLDSHSLCTRTSIFIRVKTEFGLSLYFSISMAELENE